jgi:hypothetical protein
VVFALLREFAGPLTAKNEKGKMAQTLRKIVAACDKKRQISGCIGQTLFT